VSDRMALSSDNRHRPCLTRSSSPQLLVSMGAPAKSLVNVQRRFALGLAEILNKHIAEQRTLFDGVVEGDVGMGMRVEPMFGHAAFSAFAIVLFQQGHCVGFDIEGGEAEGAFAGEANQVPVNE
jgi:hypothetical protein